MNEPDYSRVAKYVGRNASGPLFDIIIHIPDPLERDEACTDRQREAVNKFYHDGVGSDLTGSQAHRLLSYRGYSTSCTDIICSDHDEKVRLMVARAVAAYISSSPEIAAYATTLSKRRFRAGSESSRPAQTKYFGKIASFCDYIFDVLNTHGVVL